MTNDPNNHELHAAVMAAALSSVLEPNEGIVVHHEDIGYFVFLDHDAVDDTYNIVVNSDPAFLQVPNYERVNLADTEHDDIFEKDENITLQ